MADIFLSYARREQAKALPIKDALEAIGLNVFFDVDGLDGGDVFPDVLDREVKTAGAVISLWSPHALSRPWIKIESRIGKDRGVLIPVDIAPIDALHDLPAAFYDEQRVDMIDFNGDRSNAGWLKLIKSIARTLERPDLLEREARRPAQSRDEAEGVRAELAVLQEQMDGLAAKKLGAAKKSSESERAFASIAGSLSTKDYQRFLKRFPDGAEAFDAEGRLGQLEDWAEVDQTDASKIDRWLETRSDRLFPALASEVQQVQRLAKRAERSGAGGWLIWALLGAVVLAAAVAGGWYVLNRDVATDVPDAAGNNVIEEPPEEASVGPGPVSRIIGANERIRLTGHTGIVRSVAFSPDGQTLATGSNDGTAKLWNTQTGELVSSFEGHNGIVWSVAFSPKTQTVLAGSGSGTARLFSTQTGQLISTLKGHSNSIYSVSFRSDGKIIATGSTDATAKLWDAQTREVIFTLEGHNFNVLSVAFSPDGQTLATGSHDKTAKLWNTQTGALISTLKGHEDSVLSVTFSPEGQTLATGSKDRTAKLWNTLTGELISTLNGRGGSVTSVAFSPDGQTLAPGSHDNTAKLWNTKTGKLISTLEGHADLVRSVAFSPDGQTIATGSDDTTAILWDLEFE